MILVRVSFYSESTRASRGGTSARADNGGGKTGSKMSNFLKSINRLNLLVSRIGNIGFACDNSTLACENQTGSTRHCRRSGVKPALEVRSTLASPPVSPLYVHCPHLERWRTRALIISTYCYLRSLLHFIDGLRIGSNAAPWALSHAMHQMWLSHAVRNPSPLIGGTVQSISNAVGLGTNRNRRLSQALGSRFLAKISSAV